jgi:deoxyribonuclease-4
MIRFGPSGNSDSFYSQGHKSSVEMPLWLKKMGLSAYEYQCSKGIKISRKTAAELGKEAERNDIFLSIHAPYYINMASAEEEKRNSSIDYVLKTMEAAQWMGASRVVVHTGSCAKTDRAKALNKTIEVMKETIQKADEMGLSGISICPEVLGKVNQLGTLEEILEICRIDERLIPAVDFGHLHARGMGCLNSPQDFETIIEKIENELGTERMRKIHCHFSKVEFSSGGEKRHRSICDTEYGPEFEHLAVVLCKRNIEPVIICESRENMAEDALKLKQIYESVKERV